MEALNSGCRASHTPSGVKEIDEYRSNESPQAMGMLYLCCIP